MSSVMHAADRRARSEGTGAERIHLRLATGGGAHAAATWPGSNAAPVLADQGSPAALEAQARKAAVPTTVEAEPIGRYRQEVESAIYFCALEALNDVAGYSEASHASVKLLQRNGSLTFSVDVDGRGFDPNATEQGTGLQGMADRLEAIRGELTVESAPGRGTSVAGRVSAGGTAS